MSVETCFKDILSLDGAVKHSEIYCSPKDIDIYIPLNAIEKACNIAIKNGFVYMKKSTSHNVLIKFEDAKLYILDLIPSFSILCELLYDFKLSSKGDEILCNNPSLCKDFKRFIQHDLKMITIVDKNRLMSFFLCDKNYISNKNFTNLSNLIQVKSVINKFKFLSKTWYRINAHTKAIVSGMSISFLGPDGSGKTYVIDLLKMSTRNKVQYMGDWFFGMQFFYTLLMKIPTPYNRFVYIFYFFEKLVRSLKVFIYKNMGYIVLIDRFPGTNRASILSGILYYINKITYKIMPKPTLFVLLLAKPETVYGRKQELSINEIELIQKSIKKIVNKENYILFDTENLDNSLNKLLKIIYKNINEK